MFWKKKLATLLMVLVACSGTGGYVKAETTTEESNITYWTEDGLARYYETERAPDIRKEEISLAAARNEYESGQVILRSEKKDFTVSGVKFTPLTNGENAINSENLSYHFALYEWNVPTNTVGKPGFGQDGGPLYPKNGLPDPLSNEKIIHVKQDNNQPIYIKAYIPEGTPSGIYKGSARVDTTLGDIEVPIQVEVFDATVPSIKDAGFTYYNWMSDIAQGYWTEWNVFETYYGIEDVLADASDFTPEFYEITDNWAKSMVEHRQNAVLIHTVALLDAANSKVDEKGNYEFDWTLFDKYVDVWLSNGMTRVAGIHFGYHNKDVMLERDANGNASFTWENYSQSIDYNEAVDNWYKQYLPALAEHIEAFDITKYEQFNGTEHKTLFDIWNQQLYDEPTNVKLWTYYAKITDKYLVNSEGKQVKILDADNTGATRFSPYIEYLDIQVPQLDSIPNNEETYQMYQAQGKEFWSYVSLAPPKPWLNRFIHQPDTTYPLLFWYQAQINSTGYLHWALNVWNVGWFYDGDGYIIYPDIENKDVLSSIRFEGQRDGVEDWELFQIAKKVDGKKVQEILNRAIKHPKGEYVQVIEPYRALRQALLELASGNREVNIPEVDIESGLVAPEAPTGAYYVDNLSPEIQYTNMGVYKHESEKDSYRKSVHYENYGGPIGSEGGTAELIFSGTGIEVMSEKRSNKGTIQVELERILADGTTELIETVRVESCLSQQIKPFFVPYKKTGLEYGEYRIRITNIRTENGKDQTQMVLDAFIVHTMRPDGTNDVAKVTIQGDMKGTLRAMSEGKLILPGDKVKKGKDIVIIAEPQEGYYCKYININGMPVGMQNNEYIIYNIDKDVTIAPLFEKIPDELGEAVNVAINRTVTASSVASRYGYKVQDVVDGVKVPEANSRGWSNDEDSRVKDVWITIELDELTSIDHVNLYWNHNSQYSPNLYEVQVSKTGEEGDFVTVFRQEGKLINRVSHKLPEVDAKFIRIWMPKDTGASHPAVLLHEIEVMKTLGHDKTLLSELIEEIQQIDTEKYTEDSVEHLEKVLKEAIICKKNKYATIEEIQVACECLRQARDGLVLKVRIPTIYTVGTGEVIAGDQYKLNLGIQTLEMPIYAQEIYIKYDEEVFGFQQHNLLNGTQYVAQEEEPGKIRILTVTPEGTSNGVDLMTIVFDVVADVTTTSVIQIQGQVGVVENEKDNIISKIQTLIPDQHSVRVEAQVKPEWEQEDVNQDQQVDIADLALVAYYYQKIDTDPNWEDEIKKADVNGDGKIDIDDLTLVANKILNQRE